MEVAVVDLDGREVVAVRPDEEEHLVGQARVLRADPLEHRRQALEQELAGKALALVLLVDDELEELDRGLGTHQATLLHPGDVASDLAVDLDDVGEEGARPRADDRLEVRHGGLDVIRVAPECRSVQHAHVPEVLLLRGANERVGNGVDVGSDSRSVRHEAVPLGGGCSVPASRIG